MSWVNWKKKENTWKNEVVKLEEKEEKVEE